MDTPETEFWMTSIEWIDEFGIRQKENIYVPMRARDKQIEEIKERELAKRIALVEERTLELENLNNENNTIAWSGAGFDDGDPYGEPYGAR